MSLLFWPALASAAEPHEGGDAKPKLLVVPAVFVGEVRPIHAKRIQKSLSDALAASSRVELLTDKDHAEKPALAKDKIAPVKATPQSRKIDEADLWRQEGTDLAAEGKAKEALAKFRDAIAGYEHASAELVDFSKLADAYEHAGLAVYASGGGLAEATRLFEAGMTIQPTLPIDRRKQEKELLDAFDAAHERLDKAKRFEITVEGAGEGAEMFVDGVKVGPLPGKSTPLPPGTHYVQVRGANWQPWASAVKIKNKDVAVTAKLIEIKKEKPARKETELGIDAMDDCAQAGAFATDKCRIPAGKLGKQTGATFLIFCAVKADRYNRLSLHPFVQEAATGATVALKPIDLAADLGDLNARASTFESDVADGTEHFARARALTSAPKVYAK